jgi:two-component system chemotaxis sensor kinase CheA
MLGMGFVAEQAHSIEELLVLLRGKKSGKREIQQRLLKQFDEFFTTFTQVKNLIDRIGSFHVQFRPTRKHESDILFKSISNLIKSLASKYNKVIDLDYSKYDSTIVPHHYKLLIRDILVQLTRNAVYHGIESTDERLSKNKDRKGFISISNSIKDQNFYLSLKDDGRGLQLDKIKQMTIKSGVLSNTQIKNLSKKQITELIFLQGLTTTENTDITAGRGVGMDIIKSKVKKFGGTILIESEPDLFTKFTIILPIKKQ